MAVTRAASRIAAVGVIAAQIAVCILPVGSVASHAKTAIAATWVRDVIVVIAGIVAIVIVGVATVGIAIVVAATVVVVAKLFGG